MNILTHVGWKCVTRQRQKQPKTQRLHTWYSSELSPAAVATCSSCAGVCFLKIFCSKTKMFADSGEVCSSTARPPYLRQQMFFLVSRVSGEKCIFTVVNLRGISIDFLISTVLDLLHPEICDVPSGAWQVVGVHLLLRGKQTEGLAAVKCRDTNVIWEVVLGVHHV